MNATDPNYIDIIQPLLNERKFVIKYEKYNGRGFKFHSILSFNSCASPSEFQKRIESIRMECLKKFVEILQNLDTDKKIALLNEINSTAIPLRDIFISHLTDSLERTEIIPNVSLIFVSGGEEREAGVATYGRKFNELISEYTTIWKNEITAFSQQISALITTISFTELKQKAVSLNIDKIKFNLSVKQIALLMKLMSEGGIFEMPNKTAFSKTAEAIFSSIEQKNIAQGSFYNGLTEVPSSSDLDKVKEIIKKLYLSLTNIK